MHRPSRPSPSRQASSPHPWCSQMVVEGSATVVEGLVTVAEGLATVAEGSATVAEGSATVMVETTVETTAAGREMMPTCRCRPAEGWRALQTVDGQDHDRAGACHTCARSLRHTCARSSHARLACAQAAAAFAVSTPASCCPLLGEPAVPGSGSSTSAELTRTPLHGTRICIHRRIRMCMPCLQQRSRRAAEPASWRTSAAVAPPCRETPSAGRARHRLPTSSEIWPRTDQTHI